MPKGPEKSTKETLKEFIPMPPAEGPPLPKGWGIKWPWKK